MEVFFFVVGKSIGHLTLAISKLTQNVLTPSLAMFKRYTTNIPGQGAKEYFSTINIHAG